MLQQFVVLRSVLQQFAVVRSVLQQFVVPDARSAGLLCEVLAQISPPLRPPIVEGFFSPPREGEAATIGTWPAMD